MLSQGSTPLTKHWAHSPPFQSSGEGKTSRCGYRHKGGLSWKNQRGTVPQEEMLPWEPESPSRAPAVRVVVAAGAERPCGVVGRWGEGATCRPQEGLGLVLSSQATEGPTEEPHKQMGLFNGV